MIFKKVPGSFKKSNQFSIGSNGYPNGRSQFDLHTTMIVAPIYASNSSLSILFVWFCSICCSSFHNFTCTFFFFFFFLFLPFFLASFLPCFIPSFLHSFLISFCLSFFLFFSLSFMYLDIMTSTPLFFKIFSDRICLFHISPSLLSSPPPDCSQTHSLQILIFQPFLSSTC